MQNSEFQQVVHKDLGLLEYNEALAVQNSSLEKVREGAGPILLTVEHPNTLTLGKNANPLFLLRGREFYEAKKIAVIPTDRGGEVTAHVPGQLVVYPIVPMSIFSMSVRKYVSFLEKSVMDLCKEYGVETRLDDEHPGVWVGENKICAVGVRVRERVAMHGIALNVNNSFEVFDLIVPCGIRGRGVTSLSKELGRDFSTSEFEGVKKRLVALMQQGFNLAMQ